MQSLTYKDWTVLFIPVDTGWRFSCCPPNAQAINSSSVYEASETARAEAFAFIDKLLIRLQISNILDDLLESGRISSSEHIRLTELVGALIRISATDSLSADPRLLEPPAESPPDP